MKQNHLWTLALAGVILFAGASCARKKKGNRGPREVRVTMQKLEKRTFRRAIPVQGTVVPVWHAELSARVSGTLEQLNVDEGTCVKKGDVLFGIDCKVLENQLIVKESEVNVKESALAASRISHQKTLILENKARLDFVRAEKLYKTKALSQAEYEAAEVALKSAETDVAGAAAAIRNGEAQLQQAQGNLVIARKNLADSRITAPYDCVVTEKFVEANEFVSAGKSILKIEAQDQLEVECYISAVYYDEIVQDKTSVQILLDGKLLGKAPVTYKSPAIDPASRTFKLKIKLPSSIHMASGSLCDVNIVLQEKTGYGLPADAVLLRANDRYIAYAAGKDNHAVSFEIKRGIVDGKYCEVLNYEKLLTERFVVTGQTFLNNGALYREAKAEKTGAK